MTVEGISHITAEDIRFASEFGFRIKLLGVARQTSSGIDQRVHPAMVRARTTLANVDGAANGVVVDAGEAGSFFFPAAARAKRPRHLRPSPTSVEIARGSFWPGKPGHSARRSGLKNLVKLVESGGNWVAWYLRFDVLDVPGVLAEIAGRLSEAKVSIESMIQRGQAPGEHVSIVMITRMKVRKMRSKARLKAIAASDKMRARPCMILMEAA